MFERLIGCLRSNGFRQLLMKYMTIILIPLLALAFIIALLLDRGFFSSQVRKVQDQLDAAQAHVNYSLEMVDSIRVSVDKSKSVISSLLKANPYSRVNVYNLLANYAILDPIYTDLCVFFPQTPELIYSTTGTELIGQLLQYDCFRTDADMSGQIDQMAERRLCSNLAATDELPLSAAQLRHNHSYLYICPAVGTPMGSSNVTVLLRIGTASFYSAYEAVLKHYDSSEYAMLTLDASGAIIGMTGSLVAGEELVSPSWLSGLLSSHSVVALRSEHANFSNYLFLDRNVISEETRAPMRATYPLIGGILLLSILAGFVLVTQLYRPIALLHDNILTGISEMPIDHAELKSIDQSIANIIFTYNKREEQSRHILDMMKRQLIYWGLLSNLPRTQHTEQLLNMTGFSQPNMLFCVLAIQLPSSMPQKQVDELCQDIQQTGWNHSSVVAVWIPAHDTLAVVFHMFVELDTRSRQEYAANTLHMILEQYSISSSIGVGLSQPTLFTLSRSYTTARRALNSASASYCLFEDIRAESNDRFTSCLKSLIALINEGKILDAQGELARYLQMLRDLGPNRSLFQFYIARLLNDISYPLVEMGVWSFSQLDNEIEQLMFLNLEQLCETLNALLNQISANACGASNDAPCAQEPILASVYDNLMENAFDPMLNVNLEAEKFGMPTVTLNRRFRQLYGLTMVNFVSNIRIEKAKELLRASDMRVKDIVTAVGYYDVPNFSRKFKALVGLTPGQYRQQERGAPGEDLGEDADE